MEFFAGIDFAALLPFIAVGFAAQMIDGALGIKSGHMGWGVTRIESHQPDAPGRLGVQSATA